MIDQVWYYFEGMSTPGSVFTAPNILLSLLLAFILGQTIAWIYYATHSGLSYSRSFVQSLIMLTVVISMVMSVIANSFVTAVGLMGALSIIRFRNMIKDTRDICFIFFSLVIGMAAGSQRYAVAILGTVILSLVVLYLHFTAFGAHQPHNGFLRFVLKEPMGANSSIQKTLKRFCSNMTLISMQAGGEGQRAEYAYQLMIRNARKNELMLADLENIEGMEDISLTMQEQLLEV